MISLRTLSTRSIIASLAGAGLVVAGGVAVARATSDSPSPPPPRKLDVALHDAVTAPPTAGITARIRFSNHLIAAGALSGNGSPLLAGATGRLWASSAGVRLELQAADGDAQIVWHDGTLTVYDASSNTVYRAAEGAGKSARDPARAHTPPTVAAIDAALARLAEKADVSGATPSAVAGRPAYTVRIAPKHDGGLLGAVQLAWDAEHGVPLRAAVYAQGSSTPVLELVATEVAFGAVPTSDIVVAPPAGAKVVDLSGVHADGAAETTKATGPPPAIPSPATLVGLPRVQDRTVDWKGAPARMLVYGHGLGALVVIARTADAPATATTSHGRDPLSQLPSVSLGKTTGRELPTALGTILTATRSGVDYLVLGSLPPAAAEAAARELLG